MRQINWINRHSDYRDPESRLSRRLRAVQRHIRNCLDSSPLGDVRVISVCAGQGHDLLGVLQDHPRHSDVVARLVELNPDNVAVAGEVATALGLSRVEVVAGDASLTDVYEGMAANLAIVCGLFGNISDADIKRTIHHLPMLCAPGATVVWTRHVAAPDLTPSIRRWFVESEFVELGYEIIASTFGVGANLYNGKPMEFQRGVRLFEFVGYDRLWRRPS
jgi:Putative methyltransferase